MPSQTIIHLVADFGIGDLAFSEVIDVLLAENDVLTVIPTSVPSFMTISTGFVVAQLALRPCKGRKIIYHNCAPRKDNLKARSKNDGEPLVYAKLRNEVEVIGVWSNHTFSFIKDEIVEFRVVNVSSNGSQFRSRDNFPQIILEIARGNYEHLGVELQTETIELSPTDCVGYVDKYGNTKTCIRLEDIPSSWQVGQRVTVTVGNVSHQAIFSDGTMNVANGTLVFAPGSSGSLGGQPDPKKFMEIFWRGKNAARFFAPWWFRWFYEITKTQPLLHEKKVTFRKK